MTQYGVGDSSVPVLFRRQEKGGGRKRKNYQHGAEKMEGQDRLGRGRRRVWRRTSGANSPTTHATTPPPPPPSAGHMVTIRTGMRHGSHLSRFCAPRSTSSAGGRHSHRGTGPGRRQQPGRRDNRVPAGITTLWRRRDASSSGMTLNCTRRQAGRDGAAGWTSTLYNLGHALSITRFALPRTRNAPRLFSLNVWWRILHETFSRLPDAAAHPTYLTYTRISCLRRQASGAPSWPHIPALNKLYA